MRLKIRPKSRPENNTKKNLVAVFSVANFGINFLRLLKEESNYALVKVVNCDDK